MGYEALVEERSSSVRLLEVTPELLLELLKVDGRKSVRINGRLLVCVNDSIPGSATVQSCGINERGNILLHVADASFSPVRAGAMVPRINPIYELRELGVGKT
jgi:hypothetical protein